MLTVADALRRPWQARLPDLAARYGLLGALVATGLVFTLLKPGVFLTADNTKALLTQSAPLAVVALGLTVPLVMREFDLSVAALVGLGSAAAVAAMSKAGLDWRLAILIALAIGVGAGIVNGALVAYMRLSSFIATLAMATVFTGIEYQLTGQSTLFENIPSAYTEIGRGSLILDLNNQLLVVLGVLILVWLLLGASEIGRYMYAIGGNPEAARLSGIALGRLRLAGFVISAVAAVIAGIMLSSQAASATPNAGMSLLLPAFASAFLGATAFKPGEFNAAGTLVGVLLLGVIQNGLVLFDLSSAVINMVQGGILVMALLAARLGQRR